MDRLRADNESYAIEITGFRQETAKLKVCGTVLGSFQDETQTVDLISGDDTKRNGQCSISRIRVQIPEVQTGAPSGYVT